jgi:RHS repeat-associated protein
MVTNVCAYDSNGNMTQNGVWKALPGTDPILTSHGFHFYDGFNRLTHIYDGGLWVIYTYRPDGLRLAKTVDNGAGPVMTYHIWNAGPGFGTSIANIVAELVMGDGYLNANGGLTETADIRFGVVMDGFAGSGVAGNDVTGHRADADYSLPSTRVFVELSYNYMDISSVMWYDVNTLFGVLVQKRTDDSFDNGLNGVINSAPTSAASDVNITVSYVRGLGLVSRTYHDAINHLFGVEFYTFNGRGDVTAMTCYFTADVTRTYRYDAFGNQVAPDPNDTNPFRYNAEYFDAETGKYYLRFRYYQPTTGRFTQADPYWNITNMIYGSDPQKMNERTDMWGVTHYTLVPDPWAIRQSLNLYVYAVNNPIMFHDPSGEFIISTTALLIIGGALIGGAIGGAVGNHKANQAGATGWNKVGYIATGATIGAVGGGLMGWMAAPTVIAATGVTGFSVSAAGVSTITSGGSIFTVAARSVNSGAVSQTVNTLIQNADRLKKTATVMNNIASRPYINSTQTIQQIMRASNPMQDLGTANGLKWVVDGAFNGSQGVYELVIDPVTQTILHFLFTSR